MNPEAQRMAIATACGYWWGADDDSPEKYWHHPAGGSAKYPPDYLNDLNAMHEAFRVFDNHAPLSRHEWWQRYFGQLSVTLGIPFDFMPQFTTEDAIKYHNATAAQRAEAFLRTIGKWEAA
jgi:hypothetical protein